MVKHSVLAIGGAVVKTAWGQLKEVISQDRVEILIHNGGSLFHDFQRATDPNLEGHSYPLDDLLCDFECNREASEWIWEWFQGNKPAPEGSASRLCEENGVPVLVFTGIGCDFWQIFNKGWGVYAQKAEADFELLCERFREGPFRFLCMGSAVVHPEVFAKAVAVAKPERFKADVVDFKDMYRPQTRVAKYGEYFKMSHEEYFKLWIGDKV